MGSHFYTLSLSQKVFKISRGQRLAIFIQYLIYLLISTAIAAASGYYLLNIETKAECIIPSTNYDFANTIYIALLLVFIYHLIDILRCMIAILFCVIGL